MGVAIQRPNYIRYKTTKYFPVFTVLVATTLVLMQIFTPYFRSFVCLAGLVLGLRSHIYGQSPVFSNVRTVVFDSSRTRFCADSLSIIPNSIRFYQESTLLKIDSNWYALEGDCIQLHPSFPFGKKDSLTLVYRVLPIQLRKNYSWVDSSKIKSELREIDIAFDFTTDESPSLLPEMNGLDYQGSFARGLTLGNNQSLVLNSSFNLQMAGKISDDLEIKAAITDENIPIQPEGNTQALREFDKIFIQVNKGKSSLTAGDYELHSQNSYFLQYYKKLQGLTATSSFKTNEESRLNVRASVAIPKGQFSRNNIVPIEGSQGPYSLQGNNGERFLIVLSATERVFIDGQLLKRGIDEDYVIDYNRGTLTFMAKNLITKDRRIIIEFEYADQRFQKSMLAADLDWQHKNWHVFFNFISQQDSKLTGSAQDLTKEEKIVLAQAGDDLSQALVSGIDTVGEFTPGLITYELKDTLNFNGVLIYSNDKSKTLFRARFSEVGFGNGYYIISQGAANGRVYEWVAPNELTGLPQGNYEPIIPLVAPKQQQVFTLGTEGRMGKYLTLRTEVSLSKTDLNRFSSLDKNNDTGLAAKMEVSHQLPLSKKEKPATIETSISYEWVASRYQALNPYRKTEFSRDWNINQLSSRSEEQLPNVSIKYLQPNWGHLQYYYSGYNQKNQYKGQKHGLSFQLARGRVSWISNASWLTSNASKERTIFLRPNSDLSFSILKKYGDSPGRIGVFLEHESNQKFAQVTNIQTDTLSISSRRFDFYKLYFDLPSSKKFQTGFYISKRGDFAPRHIVQPTLRGFMQSTDAVDIAWNGRWRASKSSRLNWQFTRRQLNIQQPTLTTLKGQNTWLGKLDYFFKLKKELLSSNTTYELGSGQAPKLEYNYLKVDPGQGSFTWVDRNQDSIPQLNEFEIAPFADQANYLRVSIVTNEFISTNNIRFNQSFRITPKKYLTNKKGILKIIGKLSTINTIRIYRRLIIGPQVDAWNPFAQANDTALVTAQTAMVNTLFFNKANPKFECQVGQKSNNNKSLLTSGGESRSLESYFSKIRIRINRSINVNLEAEQSNQMSQADLFKNRNFSIKKEEGTASITHILNRRVRNILSYTAQQKSNVIGLDEKLTSHQLKWAFTFTGKPKPLNTNRPMRFRANFSFVKITFDGEANSTVGFFMLQGLRPGQNLLWGINLDKQLTKSVVLSLLYNGRKTGIDAKIVHVGSMQARAVF